MIEEKFRLSLPIGTILKDGHTEYEIVATESGKGTLGQGGFGITYLARDKTLNRDVAIKEFFPNAIVARGQTLTVNTRDPDVFKTLRKYFLGEARILASFDDPRIVKVLAFFEANNTAYLVMPYLKGEKLSERIKTAPFSEGQAKNLLLQLIDALKIVHSADVLHRDIKPDNIIFDTIQTDLPILIDFGSARASDTPGLDQGTQSTFGAYTPSFSPIELNSTGTRKSAATDIYALGATIYRAMFQAGPPDSSVRFETDDECLPELEAAVTKGGVSEKFAIALRKCLELRSKDRFESLEELKMALGKQPKPVPLPVPKSWVKYAVIAIMAAASIGGGAWYWNGVEVPSYNSIDQEPVKITTGEVEGWKKARESGSILAFRSFLTKFPNGAFSDVARRKLEELKTAEEEAAKLQVENKAWLQAQSIHTVDGYGAYLEKFPNGVNRKAALQIKQDLEAAAIIALRKQALSSAMQADDKKADLIAFAAKYNGTPEAKIARAEIVKLQADAEKKREELDESTWLAALEKANAHAFNQYISQFPNGNHVEQARDEGAWYSFSGTGKEDGYRNYLKYYPNGAHVKEARDALAALSSGLLNPSWISLESAYNLEDAALLFKKYSAAFPGLQVYEQPKGIFRFALGPYPRKEAYSRARELRKKKAILPTASVVDDYDAKHLVSDVSILTPQKIIPAPSRSVPYSAERQARIAALRSAKSISDLKNVISQYPGSNEAFLADRLINRTWMSRPKGSYQLLLDTMASSNSADGFRRLMQLFPQSSDARKAKALLEH